MPRPFLFLALVFFLPPIFGLNRIFQHNGHSAPRFRVCLRLSATHICTCCTSFGFVVLKSTPFSIPLFCVCVSIFHLYVSSIYVSVFFILISPIILCLFLSFLYVCFFCFCVCISHLCVFASFIFMFLHLFLLKITSFYNGFFFPFDVALCFHFVALMQPQASC